MEEDVNGSGSGGLGKNKVMGAGMYYLGDRSRGSKAIWGRIG